MAGLVPAIHVFCSVQARRGCPATSPGMTSRTMSAAALSQRKTAVCVSHAAATACPHHRPAQARTLAHRLDHHHHVRRCHRAARRLGRARHAARILRDARHRRHRGAHRDVAADRRRLVRAQQGRPQQFLSAGAEGPADLRYRDQTHLRPAAVGLDRPLRAAADRQCRRPRRLARGAEECRLRQPAAGRVGRAIGRADPRGSRRARSASKSPPRTTAAGDCSAKAGRSSAPRTPI